MKNTNGEWEKTNEFVYHNNRREKFYIWKCKKCGTITENPDYKIKEKGFPKCNCNKLNKEHFTIPGYEEYEITKDGEVWSKLTYKYCIPHYDKDGYLRITLGKNYGRNIALHRLIALTFIPNPDNLPFINHKDENKSNNSIDNLEWCTPKYNSNYGTFPERRKNSNRNKSIIRDDGVIYKSVHEAARIDNVKVENINKVLHGKRLTTGGHSYSYYYGEKE